MDTKAEFERQLERLHAQAEPPIAQPLNSNDNFNIEQELRVRRSLRDLNVSATPVAKAITAAIKSQIVTHRRIRTATSRVLEMDVCDYISNHPLAAVGTRMLFGKLCVFLECVAQRRPALVSEEIDIDQLRELYQKGNQRQHFHAIRNLLAAFRVLLRHLSDVDQAFLYKLGELGVLIPSEVTFFVANAAFGDTDEILSPPEHLRQVWKPVAKERIAPGDGGGGQVGDATREIWRTKKRVKECCTPPITAFELEDLFGENATLASHANERLPYDCGAYKYTLLEQDSFVIDCTNRGLFTTSGPSGTAYRQLAMWLVLGGSRNKLPEMRFATAALLLGGSHHSLIEVMSVCGPIVGCEMPRNVRDMLEQLVPRKLELEWEGESCFLTPESFYSELSRRLYARLT